MIVLVIHAKITQPVLILSTSSAVTAYLDLMEHAVKIVRHIAPLNLKLYCKYEYTKPCMINRIWGLKRL